MATTTDALDPLTKRVGLAELTALRNYLLYDIGRQFRGQVSAELGPLHYLDQLRATRTYTTEWLLTLMRNFMGARVWSAEAMATYAQLPEGIRAVWQASVGNFNREQRPRIERLFERLYHLTDAEAVKNEANAPVARETHWARFENGKLPTDSNTQVKAIDTVVDDVARLQIDTYGDRERPLSALVSQGASAEATETMALLANDLIIAWLLELLLVARQDVVTPHFSVVVQWFAGPRLREPDNEVPPSLYVVRERADFTFASFVGSNLGSPLTVAAVLFELLFSLEAAYRQMRFLHGNLTAQHLTLRNLVNEPRSPYVNRDWRYRMGEGAEERIVRLAQHGNMFLEVADFGYARAYANTDDTELRKRPLVDEQEGAAPSERARLNRRRRTAILVGNPLGASNGVYMDDKRASRSRDLCRLGLSLFEVLYDRLDAMAERVKQTRNERPVDELLSERGDLAVSGIKSLVARLGNFAELLNDPALVEENEVLFPAAVAALEVDSPAGRDEARFEAVAAALRTGHVTREWLREPARCTALGAKSQLTPGEALAHPLFEMFAARYTTPSNSSGVPLQVGDMPPADEALYYVPGPGDEPLTVAYEEDIPSIVGSEATILELPRQGVPQKKMFCATCRILPATGTIMNALTGAPGALAFCTESCSDHYFLQ